MSIFFTKIWTKSRSMAIFIHKNENLFFHKAFPFGYTSYNMLPKQRWIFDNSIVLKYFWVKKKGKNSSAVTFLGILIPKLSWAATNETRAFGAYFHRKYSRFIYFRTIMLKKGFQFEWTLYGVCVCFLTE